MKNIFIIILLSIVLNAKSSVKTMQDVENITKTKIKKSILYFGGINKYVEGMAKGFNDKIQKQKSPEILGYNYKIISATSMNNTLVYKIVMNKNLFIEEMQNLFKNTTKNNIEKFIYTNKYKDYYTKEFKKVNVVRYCSLQVFKALFEETMVLDFVISFDDGEIYTTFSIDNTDCMNNNITMIKPKPEIRTIYYDTGEVHIKMRFVNSIMNGISKSYYKNGKLQAKMNYKNGKLNGVSNWYFENGKLSGNLLYKNGKLSGVSKTYYKNGKLKLKSLYKKDKKESYILFVYYKNGKLHDRLSYKNGKLFGLSEIFYKNGNLQTQEYYLNGKLHGTRKEYFDNGKLYKQNNYRFGKLADGRFYEYYKNGKLKYQEYYKNNKLKKLKHFYKNGKLKKEATYDKNMNGKIITYTEKGIILAKYIVKNGKVTNKDME